MRRSTARGELARDLAGTGWRSAASGRPGRADGSARRRCPRRARIPAAVIEALAAARRAGPGGERRPALLRLRHRRHAAGRARRRLADLGVGPERRAARRCRPPPRRPSRPSPSGAASCSACPRAPRVGLVHRRADGQRHRARRGAQRGPRAAPAGTSRRTGLAGAPPRARDRRRRGARHGLQRAAAARPRPRHARSACRPTSRAGCAPDALAEALARRRRPDDRLRAGRQREHGRLRPVRADRRGVPRARRVVPRRRRLRALGGGRARAARTSPPAPPAPTPGRSTRTSGSTSPTTRALAFVAEPAPLGRGDDAHRRVPDDRGGGERNGADWAPEASRRARAFPL